MIQHKTPEVVCCPEDGTPLLLWVNELQRGPIAHCPQCFYWERL